MKITNLIDERYVFTSHPARDYEAALEFIAGHLASERLVHCSASDLTGALLQREALGGTVLPNGLAIPHVRLDCINDFWISLLTPAHSIEREGVKVRLIALFLIPKSGSDIYLQTLSGLSKFTSDETRMSALCSAGSAGQLLDVLETLNIKKDFLVEDIMTREPVSVHPDTTIREVADLLYSRNLSYLPVLDDRSHFVGEITLLDLIREGIPDYALRIGDLSFLKSFEPFEELIRKEDSMKVRQVMRKPEVKVHPGDSIAVAGLQFIRHSRRQIPVLEGANLVGVLSIIDLLKKVIRV